MAGNEKAKKLPEYPNVSTYSETSHHWLIMKKGLLFGAESAPKTYEDIRFTSDPYGCPGALGILPETAFINETYMRNNPVLGLGTIGTGIKHGEWIIR